MRNIVVALTLLIASVAGCALDTGPDVSTAAGAALSPGQMQTRALELLGEDPANPSFETTCSITSCAIECCNGGFCCHVSCTGYAHCC
jgi:hypothetical protein